MRTLLLLLLSSSCFAAGPKYSHDPAKLDDEIGNIYHDIGAVLKGNVKISSATISSGTVTSLTSSTATIAVINSPSIKIVQWASYSVTSASTTQSATFVPSDLSATITPKSASNKVVILVYGFHFNTGANSNSLNIFRNGSSLGNATYGFVYTAVVADQLNNGSLAYVDSPNSTDAQTYTVYMRTSGNTMSFGSAQGDPKTILLFELSP